ncbi:MAG: rRNA maturation RNase YbeY [bacterium]|nr:rRNA maturation RNase YbeY [bacterium]
MLQHIENKTKEKIPPIPFADIAGYTMNQGYELSLGFVSNATSKRLNNTYRQKNKPTNILSFPLSKTEGEILIAIKVVQKEAKELGEELSAYLAYIFIHGLAHLEGLDHGSRMEEEEKKIRYKFRDIFKSSNLL